MLVLWAGCAPARDVRASVWLTFLCTPAVSTSVLSCCPGGAVALHTGYAMQQASSTIFASLAFLILRACKIFLPARNIATYHVNLYSPMR